MSNEQLSPEDAQALFNNISASIRDDDANKLAEFVKPTEPKEEVTPTPVETPTPPADDKKVDEKEETEVPPKQEETPAVAESKDDDKEKKETPEEPEEVKKLREQLANAQREAHSLRSQAGRVPHIQRRLQELDAQLDALKKSGPTSDQPSTKITPKVQAILKGISETDPELAKAVAEAIGAASDEVAQSTHESTLERTRSAREETYKDYQKEQIDILLEAYPNAKEVVTSPHWADWKSKQSNAVRLMADSDDASDVMFAFERYAADMVKAHPELVEPKKDEPAAPVVDQAAAERARKIEEERLRKKETAVVTGTPAASGQVSMPDDADALFRKYSEEIRKARNG